jgi:inorganic pyrophosphatase
MTEQLRVVVEIPRGSRNRYEWDEKLQAINLDRFLFGSMVYPHRLRLPPGARGHYVTVDGWRSREEAPALIEASQQRHREQRT